MIFRKILLLRFGLAFISMYFVFPSALLAGFPPIKPWYQQSVILKTYQQSYDWRTPWEKREISTLTGMAIVVSLDLSTDTSISETNSFKNLFLLTTAEMVADATLIEATRKGNRSPFQAKLVLMDYAANLALLKINDAIFWENLRPVEWSSVKENGPADVKEIFSLKLNSQQKWEFESGKIEQMTVGHRDVSDAWFPLLKLSGVSFSGQGYPLLQDNETVGMILTAAGGKAKAMPAEMLYEFLQHAKSSPYLSLAHRGFSWRKLPQHSAAEYFQIPAETPGIWISRVLPFGTGSEVLKQGDYITKIGKWPLSYDGKIEHPKWGLALFDLLFLDQLKAGEELELSVIRSGKHLVLKTKVAAYRENGRIVPLKRVGFPPRYVIQGGFLFQELSVNYLRMWGSNWRTRAPVRLRLFLELNNTVMIPEKNNSAAFPSASNVLSDEHHRIVLVSQVIPDPLNIGYQQLSNAVILQINGQHIRSLEDVAAAFKNPIDNFHRLDFLPGSVRMSVILPANKITEANRRIQNNFRIPKLQVL